MGDLPDNHHTRFCEAWWTERRKRDFYVDENGCVQLRIDSDTGRRLEAELVMIVRDIAGARVH
jgi:hypothetical protein